MGGARGSAAAPPTPPSKSAFPVIVDALNASGRLLALHGAQILTYMKLLSVSIGLLVNFNVTSLRQGLRRRSLQPRPLPDLPDLFVDLLVPCALTLQFGGFKLLASAATGPDLKGRQSDVDTECG